MKDNNKNENLENKLDEFLTSENKGMDCNDEGCIIKTDKSLVEKINKKIMTEDGRQLLF
jgi:hypothetical protein